MNARTLSLGLRAPTLTAGLALALTLMAPSASAAADVVLYAADASVRQGNWTPVIAADAAGGRSMASTDQGWSTTSVPHATPANYFELTFDAPAATTYRVWLRMRGAGNSKWNESVWVQFSDAMVPGGASVYRIATTSALLVNLERCSGCGIASWGWQNTAYWLNQATHLQFATSGTHTVRVQIREDGVEVDQIILSPVTYSLKAPGTATNDATIVARPATVIPPPTGSSPFKGTPVALPGTIEAGDFDHGGNGISYYDTTVGNEGGRHRATDVDIQPASGGGYNVGWTAAGEWLNYTVNVAAAGAYEVQLRVASTSARAVEVAFNNVTTHIDVPSTGGWQTWKTVSTTVTLMPGTQVMTVRWPTGGVNLRSVAVMAAAGLPAPGTGSPTGGTFRVMTWNIHHGRSTTGVYNPAAQAQFIAARQPDVVLLQEVQTWDEKQPALFKSLLEQLTGVPWHVQWAPVVNSEWTEGNVVLTRLPAMSSTSHQMHATSDWSAMYSNRSAAETTVTVGGIAVHVFSTHLDAYNTSHRTAQLIDLMAWAQGFGARRIVGGDFNSTPGSSWITNMKGDYYDAWELVTGSETGGETFSGRGRIDFVFSSKDVVETVTPLAATVVQTSLSDHAAVIVDYRVIP